MEQPRYEEVGELLLVDERTNTIEVDAESGIETLPVESKAVMTMAKMMIGSRVKAILDPETKFVVQIINLDEQPEAEEETESIFRVKKETAFEPEREEVPEVEKEPPKKLPWEERKRESRRSRYSFVRTALTPAEREIRKDCLKLAVEVFISLNKTQYDFDSMDWRDIRNRIGRKVVVIAREFEDFLTYKSERKEENS